MDGSLAEGEGEGCWASLAEMPAKVNASVSVSDKGLFMIFAPKKSLGARRV